jgi:hypothetical protein
MGGLSHVGLKVENFMCFREAQGFDRIKPINVIIGRNNSGKSALIELLEFATGRVAELEDRRGHRGNTPRVLLSMPFPDLEMFPVNNATHKYKGQGYSFGARSVVRELAHQLIDFELRKDRQMTSLGVSHVDNPGIEDWLKNYLSSKCSNPLDEYTLVRILADRDVRPEQQGGQPISPDGSGLTRCIHAFIIDDSLDLALVEEKLLTNLTHIFEPDITFERILTQRLGDSPTYEVFLKEPGKGLIRLSDMGSGVKTVLQVLGSIILTPSSQGDKPLSDYMFAFEELENNLHPAVQRRLFQYLRDRAVEDQTTFFITTHSSVVIDLFGSDDQAQILHVTHNGKFSEVQQVTTLNDGRSVLSDLDVRASDILQSNVVVWVEGPSDRIYFNRWMELWTAGELTENVHYQCLPYGGSILANFSFADGASDLDETDFRSLIQALQINANAIVLMDSDRTSEEDELKERVDRVCGEIRDGIAWVTAGKEVENYIPRQALRAMWNEPQVAGPERFRDFFGYVKNNKRPVLDKAGFARRVCPHMTRDSLGEHLDLADRLDEVCNRIRSWNGL